MAKQIENALTLVKTAISSGIAARLTAIQTEMADGLTLTAPASTSYSICELLAIPAFPFIQVLPNVSNVQIPGLNWDQTDHEVLIVCHITADEGDTEKCAKRVYRYARAICDLVRANRTLTSNAISWYVTSIDYKPMMSDDYTLKQEVWINTIVKIEEVT